MATHRLPFSRGTRQGKRRLQCNSHFTLISSFYLMQATLNAEWLAWTVKIPLKVLHDQEMAGQEVNRTSILPNPTKSWTAREWEETAIKGGGEQHERGSRKNERTWARTRERKRAFLLYFHFTIPFLYHGNNNSSDINAWFSFFFSLINCMIFPLWSSPTF